MTAVKHGHTTSVNGKTVQSPTYQSYRSMLDRCTRERHPWFHRYGGRDASGEGRSIVVCARWRYGEAGLSGFQCFLEDMGVRPEGKTLDRKHWDDDYDKDHCQWASLIDQNNNTSRNKMVTIDGVKKSAAQWVDHYDRRPHYFQIINALARGTDPKIAFTQNYQPPKKRGPRKAKPCPSSCE